MKCIIGYRDYKKQWFIGVGRLRPDAYLSTEGPTLWFSDYWFPSVAQAIAIMHKYLKVIKLCSEKDSKGIFDYNNLEPNSYIFDVCTPAILQE